MIREFDSLNSRFRGTFHLYLKNGLYLVLLQQVQLETRRCGFGLVPKERGLFLGGEASFVRGQHIQADGGVTTAARTACDTSGWCAARCRSINDSARIGSCRWLVGGRA